MSDNTNTQSNGDRTEINFLGKDQLESMGVAEKNQTIIDSVSDNNVIVLEENMEPDEQAKLTEKVMMRIGENFRGIEIETSTSPQKKGLFSRFVSNKTESNLTIIGPANKMETIEENNMIRAFISR